MISLRPTLLAVWKFCLSFRRSQWGLSDYPVVIREQKIDLDSGSRLRPQRFLARVAKWWVLTGGGNTPQEAIEDLAVHFEKMKIERQRCGKSMPRPGTAVPIEFAPSDRVRGDAVLIEDFIQRVLGLDWAFISDESSLWDFHTEKTNDVLYAKIEQVYGVDVSDVESANIAEILEKISANPGR
jgi:hypothetical protein